MYKKKINGTIDIFKFLMAILVIGIHVEPFKMWPMLDRGFSLLTRICVPFFFVTSSYFYFSKGKNPLLFIKRLCLLYVIWSIIYLPFNTNINIPYILWYGNEFGLWYLWGSIVGFILVYLLLRVFKPREVLIISMIVLFIGTLKSTWSPLMIRFIPFLSNRFGERSGLFYGFPYMALGMYIAKRKPLSNKKDYFKLLLCFIALGIEAIVFTLKFKTRNTILWLSVYPLSYYLFLIIRDMNIRIEKEKSLLLRKISTLMYVSHFLFILLYGSLSGIILYLAVVVSSLILSLIIIRLSEIKALSFLKYLY